MDGDGDGVDGAAGVEDGDDSEGLEDLVGSEEVFDSLASPAFFASAPVEDEPDLA